MNDKMESLKDTIIEMLASIPRKEALKVLGEVIADYDLYVAAAMVEKDCEASTLSITNFEENMYVVGNEDDGIISLQDILQAIEEIVQCQAPFQFIQFVRAETEEENKLNNHSGDITWFTHDDSIDAEKLKLEFEIPPHFLKDE